MTKTEQIFSSTCPYDNIYQTETKRLVFVCSVGLLRSPTAAMVASKMGFNARSCGSCDALALIPLSVRLILWADKIFFMSRSNYLEAIDTFRVVGYDEDIENKSVVWDIQDDYDWGDEYLMNEISTMLGSIKL